MAVVSFFFIFLFNKHFLIYGSSAFPETSFFENTQQVLRLSAGDSVTGTGPGALKGVFNPWWGARPPNAAESVSA